MSLIYLATFVLFLNMIRPDSKFTFFVKAPFAFTVDKTQ